MCRVSPLSFCHIHAPSPSLTHTCTLSVSLSPDAVAGPCTFIRTAVTFEGLNEWTYYWMNACVFQRPSPVQAPLFLLFLHLDVWASLSKMMAVQSLPMTGCLHIRLPKWKHLWAHLEAEVYIGALLVAFQLFWELIVVQSATYTNVMGKLGDFFIVFNMLLICWTSTTLINWRKRLVFVKKWFRFSTVKQTAHSSDVSSESECKIIQIYVWLKLIYTTLILQLQTELLNPWRKRFSLMNTRLDVQFLHMHIVRTGCVLLYTVNSLFN